MLETIKKELVALKEKISEKPICIQIPEGLKQFSTLILDELKIFDPILIVDPCYGACDLKDDEAKKLGCKTLIHFGHMRMNEPSIKTIFVPVHYVLSDEQRFFVLNQIINLKEKKINLVTTTNYSKEIPYLKQKLKETGVEVADAKKTNRVSEHVILGCDASTITQKELPIIFIGDGVFHPNNLAFLFKQKIRCINPKNMSFEEININNSFLKKRYGLIHSASKANSFGVLVSYKKGQQRLLLAKKIKEKLESMNKKAYLIASDYINEDYLEGIKVDCFVNTACPRITYDDYSNFKKPMITPQEINLLANISGELKIDQIQ